MECVSHSLNGVNPQTDEIPDEALISINAHSITSRLPLESDLCWAETHDWSNDDSDVCWVKTFDWDSSAIDSLSYNQAMPCDVQPRNPTPSHKSTTEDTLGEEPSVNDGGENGKQCIFV